MTTERQEALAGYLAMTKAIEAACEAWFDRDMEGDGWSGLGEEARQMWRSFMSDAIFAALPHLEAGEVAGRTHRAPCVDGNLCGEPAHCPPERVAPTLPPGEPAPSTRAERRMWNVLYRRGAKGFRILRSAETGFRHYKRGDQ